MPRKLLNSYTKANSKTIACMGDSMTFNYTLKVSPELMWPGALQTTLRAAGYQARCRNFGRSGDRSGPPTANNCLSRISEMTFYDVPQIAIYYAGINDPLDSYSSATTQANLEAMIDAVYAAGCTRHLVVNTHYYNWSNAYTAGTQRDTLATPYTPNVGVRTAQAAAAASRAAKGVVHCDLYTYLRNLIVAGTYAEGDALWHYADGNIHYNALGESLIAAAVFSTIQAQNWLTLLKG